MTEPGREALAAAVVDAVRQAAAHYGLWLAEAVHQVGLEAALRAERQAGDRGAAVVLARLCQALGCEVQEGLPEPLLRLDEDTLKRLLDSLAKSWLALDGVWFQAIEGQAGMDDAKRVNDTCWSRFAPLEARRIAALHDLGEAGGLQALKTALGLRLYARINVQDVVEDEERSFVLRVRECRVQAARRRKGLPDYPCRSGGLVEYRSFAAAIDPRIHAECVACPPDAHPEEWWCAWRFTLHG